MIMSRRNLRVGQIASAVSGGKNFFADAIQTVQNGDLGGRIGLCGRNGGSHTGCAAADNKDAIHKRTSFSIMIHFNTCIIA